MFKKILVPTDFSAKSKHALDIAINVALLNYGTVYLLHVIKTIPNITFDELEDFYLKLEDRAKQGMTQLLATYQGRSQVKVEWAVVYGNRVQEILQFVEKHQIDLIVMNSHKIDVDKPEQGWGTISYKVGVLANCPIMLVK